jgi:succinoglycan biosynthesis protein ExoV
VSKMKAHCFTEEALMNFGDDLNRWMWERFLPNLLDEEDGTLFVGIGTVLGSGLPAADRYIVFSSGVGYGPLPPTFGSPAWHAVCVRGPLTAKVLGLPADKAVCDGAVLLSTLPELQPIPEAERKGVLFMPHFEALDSGDWREVCRRAGVEFLDPHLPSEETCQRIRGAKLVLADAMHAAIVADALRVPWVPLITSNRINTFKWLDWSLTLGVQYRPLELPSLSLLEALRNAGLGLHGARRALPERTEEAAMKDFKAAARLQERPWWQPYRVKARRLAYFAPAKVLRAGVLAPALRADAERRLDLAAGVLREAAKLPGYLSEETILRGKAAELQDRLEQVKEIARRS